MQYLRIKNFNQYQHYKDRNPPWIKLYRAILHDYELRSLPIPSRLAYIFCLIIASETDNRIPHDLNFLTARFGFDVDESVLTPLITSRFLLASGAIRVLAPDALCSSLLFSYEKSISSPDSLSSPDSPDLKSKSQTDDFEQFWLAYPKKVGKKAARVAWRNASDRPGLPSILEAVSLARRSQQWMKENGQFIPHPATWLNQGRWSDQPLLKNPTTMDAFLSRHPHREIPS